MKRILLFVIFCCAVAVSHAQTITRARFSLSYRSDNFRFIELELNNRLLVGLNGNGDIIYMTTLDGRDAYNTDSLPEIAYYDKFDIHDIPGRVKSIGNIKIAYNNVFDVHDVKGTLKSIGDIQVKYYNVFDIHDPKGKVKSVGDVSIVYYNKFDADQLFGKIKSIKGNNQRISVFINRAPMPGRYTMLSN